MPPRWVASSPTPIPMLRLLPGEDYRTGYRVAVALLGVIEAILLSCVFLDTVCIVKCLCQTLSPRFFFAVSLTGAALYTVLFVSSIMTVGAVINRVLDVIILWVYFLFLFGEQGRF